MTHVEVTVSLTALEARAFVAPRRDALVWRKWTKEDRFIRARRRAQAKFERAVIREVTP